MVTKELLDFIVNAVRAQEQVKQEKIDEQRKEDMTIPRPANQFWATILSGELIAPCQKKAEYHRSREKHYTEELEVAEKKLREEGMTVEVMDPSTGVAVAVQNLGLVCSGSINIGNTPYTASHAPKFQARMDQGMVNSVERAKEKMLSHRSKAEQYEKYTKAFKFNPKFTVRLSVDDVTYFGLGE